MSCNTAPNDAISSSGARLSDDLVDPFLFSFCRSSKIVGIPPAVHTFN